MVPCELNSCKSTVRIRKSLDNRDYWALFRKLTVFLHLNLHLSLYLLQITALLHLYLTLCREAVRHLLKSRMLHPAISWSGIGAAIIYLFGQTELFATVIPGFPVVGWELPLAAHYGWFEWWQWMIAMGAALNRSYPLSRNSWGVKLVSRLKNRPKEVAESKPAFSAISWTFSLECFNNSWDFTSRSWVI